MAAQTLDLVDITEFNMGSVRNENVLYEVLVKMCEGINAINRDTKDIKKSVDKLYTKVDNITKCIVTLEQNDKNQDIEISDLKESQKNIITEISTVKAMIESLSDQNIKGYTEYDPQVTVVASNIPVNPNENILAVANRLLEYGVRIPSLRAVRATRLTSSNRFPGIVKIEVPSVRDKIAVLQNKRNLAETSEYSKVYLRSSKSHGEHLAEFSFRKLLQQIPHGNKYRVGSNGRIMEKLAVNPRTDQVVMHSTDQFQYHNTDYQSASDLPSSSIPNVSRLQTPVSTLSDDLQCGFPDAQNVGYNAMSDTY